MKKGSMDNQTEPSTSEVTCSNSSQGYINEGDGLSTMSTGDRSSSLMSLFETQLQQAVSLVDLMPKNEQSQALTVLNSALAERKQNLASLNGNHGNRVIMESVSMETHDKMNEQTDEPKGSDVKAMSLNNLSTEIVNSDIFSSTCTCDIGKQQHYAGPYAYSSEVSVAAVEYQQPSSVIHCATTNDGQTSNTTVGLMSDLDCAENHAETPQMKTPLKQDTCATNMSSSCSSANDSNAVNTRLRHSKRMQKSCAEIQGSKRRKASPIETEEHPVIASGVLYSTTERKNPQQSPKLSEDDQLTPMDISNDNQLTTVDSALRSFKLEADSTCSKDAAVSTKPVSIPGSPSFTMVTSQQNSADVIGQILTPKKHQGQKKHRVVYVVASDSPDAEIKITTSANPGNNTNVVMETQSHCEEKKDPESDVDSKPAVAMVTRCNQGNSLHDVIKQEQLGSEYIEGASMVKQKGSCEGTEELKEEKNDCLGLDQKRLDSAEETFACQRCSESFPDQQSYTHHLTSTSHKDKPEKPEKPIFKCSECDKSYKSKFKLERHKVIHSDEQPHTCNECGRAFRHYNNLMRHVKIHSDDRPHKCPECGKGFIEPKCLRKHIKTAHEGIKISPSGSPDFTCPHCQRTFYAKSQLDLHMLCHSGEKPHKCEVCSKEFSLKANLKRHLFTHTDDKKYKCELCQKQYCERKSLMDHMRSHTGEKPFMCQSCGKRFCQKQSLEDHLPVHSRERQFACDQCDGTFLRKSHLNYHKRQHLQTPTLTCEHCDNKFFRKSDLKRHILKHTKEKPFPCHLCSRRFTRHNYLQEHLSIHTELTSFRCKYCQESFPSGHSCSQHLREAHPEHLVHVKCRHCDQLFTDNNSCAKHMKLAHSGPGKLPTLQVISGQENRPALTLGGENSGLVTVLQKGSYILDLKKTGGTTLNLAKGEELKFDGAASKEGDVVIQVSSTVNTSKSEKPMVSFVHGEDNSVYIMNSCCTMKGDQGSQIGVVAPVISDGVSQYLCLNKDTLTQAMRVIFEEEDHIPKHEQGSLNVDASQVKGDAQEEIVTNPDSSLPVTMNPHLTALIDVASREHVQETLHSNSQIKAAASPQPPSAITRMLVQTEDGKVSLVTKINGDVVTVETQHILEEATYTSQVKETGMLIDIETTPSLADCADKTSTLEESTMALDLLKHVQGDDSSNGQSVVTDPTMSNITFVHNDKASDLSESHPLMSEDMMVTHLSTEHLEHSEQQPDLSPHIQEVVIIREHATDDPLQVSDASVHTEIPDLEIPLTDSPLGSGQYRSLILPDGQAVSVLVEDAEGLDQQEIHLTMEEEQDGEYVLILNQ